MGNHILRSKIVHIEVLYIFCTGDINVMIELNKNLKDTSYLIFFSVFFFSYVYLYISVKVCLVVMKT